MFFFFFCFVFFQAEDGIRDLVRSRGLGDVYKRQVLTFAELNADPDAYRDRRIQVAGDFASVPPPTCTPHAGPSIRWSLVAEELQLNAVGFENVLRLLAEGTPMTVTGIWRLYSGPAGCGKAPPDANVWFLSLIHLSEPTRPY